MSEWNLSAITLSQSPGELQRCAQRVIARLPAFTAGTQSRLLAAVWDVGIRPDFHWLYCGRRPGALTANQFVAIKQVGKLKELFCQFWRFIRVTSPS